MLTNMLLTQKYIVRFLAFFGHDAQYYLNSQNANNEN